MQLFKSHREGIADGDQRRDFIYVDDVVRVMMWLLATPDVSGLFNVGTGAARSFRDLMLAAYTALGAKPNIEYVDMPEQIRGSYQYFTQSEVDRLRHAGYNGGFTALEDAVDAYVKGFLDRADRFLQRREATIIAGVPQPIDFALGEILIAAANLLGHVHILNVRFGAQCGVGRDRKSVV